MTLVASEARALGRAGALGHDCHRCIGWLGGAGVGLWLVEADEYAGRAPVIARADGQQLLLKCDFVVRRGGVHEVVTPHAERLLCHGRRHAHAEVAELTTIQCHDARCAIGKFLIREVIHQELVPLYLQR